VTLVAGGAGFIGSHLCRMLLDAGEHVLCIDNLQTSRPSNLAPLQAHPNFEFIQADITAPWPSSVLARARRFHRIYNLACAASPPAYQADPEHTMMTNVVGTAQLLRLAEASGARFLLTSTSEVYGDPDMHPQREDYRGNVSCTGPRACYDEGKRAAETLTFDFARSGRADVRVARIFNTYGPNMDPCDGRVVSNVICQGLSGNPITIYGDGSQTRSFCYVTDTADALRRLMEVEDIGLEPVNIGNPRELTVRELAVLVIEMLGRPCEMRNAPLPEDDPRRRRPNIDRAKALLDWQPTTSLEDGIRQTMDWFAKELGDNVVVSATVDTLDRRRRERSTKPSVLREAVSG
jgi:UDP-glucuronate decarboxylase